MIVSDFQVGTVAPIDLKGVPASIGVQLDAIRPGTVDSPVVIRSRRGAETIAARVAHNGARTDVEWSPAAGQAIPSEIVTTYTGPASAHDVNVEQQSVLAVGLAPPADTGHRIAIVYTDYPERAALRARTKPIHERWMSEASARIHRAQSPGFGYPATPADTGDLLVVTRGFENKPLVVAGAATIDGRETLVLFSIDQAQDHGLIRAADRALADVAASGELDPAVVSDSALAAWQRSPAPHESAGPNADSSDGRWLWLLALLLLGVETMLRRTAPRPATPGSALDATR